jgi:hypothetical protein
MKMLPLEVLQKIDDVELRKVLRIVLDANRPIPAKELAKKAEIKNPPSTMNSRVRDICRELCDKGFPIGANNVDGVFFIRDHNDLDDYIRSLRVLIAGIRKRIRSVREAYDKYYKV